MMNKLKKRLHIITQVWRKDKELVLLCICAVVLYLSGLIY